MRRILYIISLIFITIIPTFAQNKAKGEAKPAAQKQDQMMLEKYVDDAFAGEPFLSAINLVIYRYKDPIFEGGDTIWMYLLPDMPVYAPLKFKSEKERERYNRLVYNVKRVLPYAQQVNRMICETYKILEMLPDTKSKDKQIKAVERDIKKQYTPIMKKLTFSQGKLLIKLIDRECKQSSYEIVKAFIGPAKAAAYQVFAWTFKASLKKEYKPDTDDRLIERVCRQVETGQL